MNLGKTLFAQLMEFVPSRSFNRIVERHSGDARVSTLPRTEHFRIMAYAQSTWRESFARYRGHVGGESHQTLCNGTAPSGTPPHPTLADANERRDWRIWADFDAAPIRRANKLYLRHPRQIQFQRQRCVLTELEKTIGVVCDQSVALNGHYARRDYPEHLRRVRFKDPDTGKTLIF